MGDREPFQPTLWGLLTRGLNQSQITGAVVMGWRLFIIIHIFWVCGLLVQFGVDTPFAKAASVQDLQLKINTLEKASALTNKLALTRELRLQIQVYCRTEDKITKTFLLETIDRLQEDYIDLTKTAYSPWSCS